MADDMVQFCIELAKRNLEGVKDWQAQGDDAVSAMKEALDAKYGPHWAVIAGKRWGASITHDQKHFINFVVGKDINVTVRKGSLVLFCCFLLLLVMPGAGAAHSTLFSFTRRSSLRLDKHRVALG